MHIHDFLKELREDGKNEGILMDSLKLIKELSHEVRDDLVLHIPLPKDWNNKERAKFIHGNVFEDFVLKAAIEDGKPKIKLQGIYKNREDVDKKMTNTDKKFVEIFGDSMNSTMMTKYKNSMDKAGSYAWKMLSKHFTMTEQTEVTFEDEIKTTKSDKLTGTLRADIVARKDEKVFLVDLKYSSMEKESYEQDYIANGIVQVLIYGILKEVKLENLKLGILVYYAMEGKVILYEIKHDETCIQKVKELIIPDGEVDKMETNVGNNVSDSVNKMDAKFKKIEL